MARRELTVFVSSTSNDLQDYRAIARNVILEVGWVPRMMEYFGALPELTVSACRSTVEQCDAMLLIVGFQRGWVPAREQGGDGVRSITALELATARERRIPVLVMLASETWPQNLCEKDPAARAWVEQFRGTLNLPAEFFDYELPTTDESRRLSAFRNKVKNVLLAHRERLAERREPAAPTPHYFESARVALLEGNCIPFVGPGVYGAGPLSPPALVGDLWADAPADQACTATASEYAERLGLGREAFLSRFARILTDQTGRAGRVATYDLIARLTFRPPPLVVSVCHDLVLENLLAANRKCAIVSHIVRSSGGEHDGKLLVSVLGQPPVICLADKLDVTGFDLVIYKPLGSPLLHPSGEEGPWSQGLDQELLEIDTVVATEADHPTFLGRLENQHTKVPSVFHRPFQRKVVLFLGLQLDVWHYRLVLQVFRSVELKSGQSRSMAVRTPGSAMETLAWEHLNTKMLHQDPNDFAATVMGAVR